MRSLRFTKSLTLTWFTLSGLLLSQSTLAQPQAATSTQTATTAPSKSVALHEKPLWAELSASQKQALSPLQSEWDAMPGLRKKKWLEIAQRYAILKPEEQARMQERMREWVKLTPEQRMAARENYAKATKLNAEQKSAQWLQYQQLSEDEKKRLAEEHNKKKIVTNLQPSTIKNPPPPPLKVGPKPAPASTSGTSEVKQVQPSPAAVAASQPEATPNASAASQTSMPK